MCCCCMQLATLHNDGKEASASEVVFQQALKMTYERLISPYHKVVTVHMCVSCYIFEKFVHVFL